MGRMLMAMMAGIRSHELQRGQHKKKVQEK